MSVGIVILALTAAVGSEPQLALSDHEPINVAVEAARWEALAKMYATEEQKVIASAIAEETRLEEAVQGDDVNDYINYYFGGEGSTAEDPGFGGGDFSRAVPL